MTNFAGVTIANAPMEELGGVIAESGLLIVGQLPASYPERAGNLVVASVIGGNRELYKHEDEEHLTAISSRLSGQHDDPQIPPLLRIMRDFNLELGGGRHGTTVLAAATNKSVIKIGITLMIPDYGAESLDYGVPNDFINISYLNVAQSDQPHHAQTANLGLELSQTIGQQPRTGEVFGLGLRYGHDSDPLVLPITIGTAEEITAGYIDAFRRLGAAPVSAATIVWNPNTTDIGAAVANYNPEA